jgi:GT2 family glycosyltransferase
MLEMLAEKCPPNSQKGTFTSTVCDRRKFFARARKIDRKLKLTIVIPTYNREAKLNALLRSILACSLTLQYDVVIVDDSEYETRIDQDIKRSLAPNLSLIHHKSRVLISKAKNIGWKKSKSEYVFFIDDDNVVPRGTIETLISRLESDSRIGALMPVVYYLRKPNVVWVYSAPFSKGRWKFDLIGRNLIETTKPHVDLLPTDALPNAFMTRTSLLRKVDGFDESLAINSSCDLCQKIKSLGYGVFALTRAAVFHDVSPPDVPGYWAEHASEDSIRRYYEVKDWFVLMARLHAGETFLPLKEFIQSMRFIPFVFAGILMHPTPHKQYLTDISHSMLRGLRDGVRLACRNNFRGFYSFKEES